MNEQPARWSDGKNWRSMGPWPRVSVLVLVAALLLLLGPALVHGIWTQRWRPTRELEEAAQRIDQVPLSIGDWQGTPLMMEPELIAQAGLTSCWMRTYARPVQKDQVTVVLMCGRTGPTSVHTPDWCLGGEGYEMPIPPRRVTVPLGTEKSAAFWSARFVKPEFGPGAPLLVYWSWNDAGRWQAPDNPRLTFAGRPFLYKLYVIQVLNSLPEREEVMPETFLRPLLAKLDTVLFSKSVSRAGEASRSPCFETRQSLLHGLPRRG